MSVLISNVYLAWKQSLQGNAVWNTITALMQAAPQSPLPPIINVTFIYSKAWCRLKIVDYLLLGNTVYISTFIRN